MSAKADASNGGQPWSPCGVGFSLHRNERQSVSTGCVIMVAANVIDDYSLIAPAPRFHMLARTNRKDCRLMRLNVTLTLAVALSSFALATESGKPSANLVQFRQIVLSSPSANRAQLAFLKHFIAEHGQKAVNAPEFLGRLVTPDPKTGMAGFQRPDPSFRYNDLTYMVDWASWQATRYSDARDASFSKDLLVLAIDATRLVTGPGYRLPNWVGEGVASPKPHKAEFTDWLTLLVSKEGSFQNIEEAVICLAKRDFSRSRIWSDAITTMKAARRQQHKFGNQFVAARNMTGDAKMRKLAKLLSEQRVIEDRDLRKVRALIVAAQIQRTAPRR